jgi:uncharacterized SAM-binding protein YcdF (DUF218 family)
VKFIRFFIIAGVIVVAGIIAVGFYLSPQNELKPADAIVVISGGETDQRVKEGVELFHQGLAPTLIMSGAARDSGISNAAAMQRSAVSQGVAEERILVEDKAQDTLGNAKYVRELLSDHDIKSIILVTSPYHQRRAYLTFCRYLGKDFPIINHSAADSAWRKNGWWENAWARHLTFQELGKIIYLMLFFPASK